MTTLDLKVKGYAGLAWAILVIMLFTGLAIHTNDWTSYWALWLTEGLAMLLVAFYFYRPSTLSGVGMALGGLIWLVNQLLCWYLGELTQQTFVQTMMTLQYVFVFTFIVEAVLVGLVYLKSSGNRGGTEGKLPATIGLIIMGVYSLLKMVTLYRTWILYGGFVPGTPQGNSAYTWAGGVMIMAFGSLIALHSSDDSAGQRIGGYIALVGLVVASFAALYYGLALATLGVP